MPKRLHVHVLCACSTVITIKNRPAWQMLHVAQLHCVHTVVAGGCQKVACLIWLKHKPVQAIWSLILALRLFM